MQMEIEREKALRMSAQRTEKCHTTYFLASNVMICKLDLTHAALSECLPDNVVTKDAVGATWLLVPAIAGPRTIRRRRGRYRRSLRTGASVDNRVSRCRWRIALWAQGHRHRARSRAVRALRARGGSVGC